MPVGSVAMTTAAFIDRICFMNPAPKQQYTTASSIAPTSYVVKILQRTSFEVGFCIDSGIIHSPLFIAAFTIKSKVDRQHKYLALQSAKLWPLTKLQL